MSLLAPNTTTTPPSLQNINFLKSLKKELEFKLSNLKVMMRQTWEDPTVDENGKPSCTPADRPMLTAYMNNVLNDLEEVKRRILNCKIFK